MNGDGRDEATSNTGTGGAIRSVAVSVTNPPPARVSEEAVAFVSLNTQEITERYLSECGRSEAKPSAADVIAGLSGQIDALKEEIRELQDAYEEGVAARAGRTFAAGYRAHSEEYARGWAAAMDSVRDEIDVYAELQRRYPDTDVIDLVSVAMGDRRPEATPAPQSAVNLNVLESLHEKASKGLGRWMHSDHEMWGTVRGQTITGVVLTISRAVGDPEQERAIGAFIANAYNAMPDLIAEVRRHRRERASR